jgi:hypothetical protein
LPAEIAGGLDCQVEPPGHSRNIAVRCADNDAFVSRELKVQSAKMPPVVSQDCPTVGNRYRQYFFVLNGLARAADILDRSDVMSQGSQLGNNWSRKVLIGEEESHS